MGSLIPGESVVPSWLTVADLRALIGPRVWIDVLLIPAAFWPGLSCICAHLAPGFSLRPTSPKVWLDFQAVLPKQSDLGYSASQALPSPRSPAGLLAKFLISFQELQRFPRFPMMWPQTPCCWDEEWVRCSLQAPRGQNILNFLNMSPPRRKL